MKIIANLNGTLVRGVGGFYYVTVGFDEYVCKARGKFRKENISPMVGDKVMIAVLNNNEKTGNIEKIYPRKNELLRPKVANVDQVVLVFSIQDPAINLELLDSFLVLTEAASLEAVIVLNKDDIASKDELNEIRARYQSCGYPVFVTSTVTLDGINELREVFLSKVSALAGPSGVGKSSLLNAVFADEKMETGEISKKIKRGKHTTRHTELIRLNECTFLVDTPGFTSLSTQHIDKKDLAGCFPELAAVAPNCIFSGCSHIKEGGCAVLESVGSTIDKARYERYKAMYNELARIRRY